MEDQKQGRTINALYWMLIISSILSFVPNISAQILSLVMLTVVLLAAYFYKGRDQKDGLVYNHMTYMIGTIWISTTLLILGVALAGLWVYSSGDAGAINNAIARVHAGMMPGEDELHAIGMEYIKTNETLMIMAAVSCIGPGILYFVYRVANGFSRAAKGYRIANPKSWL